MSHLDAFSFVYLRQNELLGTDDEHYHLNWTDNFVLTASPEYKPVSVPGHVVQIHIAHASHVLNSHNFTLIASWKLLSAFTRNEPDRHFCEPSVASCTVEYPTGKYSYQVFEYKKEISWKQALEKCEENTSFPEPANKVELEKLLYF